MKKKNDALVGIRKVNALMSAYESLYLQEHMDYETCCKAQDTFYAIWDEVKMVLDSLEQGEE